MGHPGWGGKHTGAVSRLALTAQHGGQRALKPDRVHLVVQQENRLTKAVFGAKVAAYHGGTAAQPVSYTHLDVYKRQGQIISRDTIEQSIDGGEAYRIVLDGQKVGGIVIKVDGEKGDLDLLFVSPAVHSKGIGYAAWCAVEKLHPEVNVWETVTPYFEKRNIHFYVNRCGFHIVEFFNKYHPDPNDPEMCAEELDEQFPDGMFRFEKVIR